jgi:hypothetical protein
VEVPVKESRLVALRLKLAFGITMLLLCSVARADSVPVPIPCPNSFCAGDTDTVTLIAQPPGVIGLGAADTIIGFGFLMVDNEGVDMDATPYLLGPDGSGINVGGDDTLCDSPGSAYNNTVVPGEAFTCGLSVDIGNEFTAMPGIYTYGMGLLDWVTVGGSLVVWNPKFTVDVLPAVAADEPSTWLLLIPGLLAVSVLRLKRATL